MAAGGSSVRGAELEGSQPLENGTLLTPNHDIQSGIVVHNEELSTFAQNELLCRPFTYNYGPGTKNVRVLTVLGVRIFRGIMSCVLKAHEADLAYKGFFSVQVSVFKLNGVTVPETAGVRITGKRVVPMDHGARKDDYDQLRKIIKEAFMKDNGPHPLHVVKIHAKLGTLAADKIDPPKTKTQLLQALAATVDPLVMATMWWNLVRFQDSLGPDPCPRKEKKELLQKKYKIKRGSTHQRTHFDAIVNKSYVPRDGWHELKNDSSRFKEYKTGGTATDLLSIARNWITHFPEEESTERFYSSGAAISQQNPAPIHELDYYFSTHFPDFMADVLITLYSNNNSTQFSQNLTRALLPY